MFEENLLECHFGHLKSHITWTRIESGPEQWTADEFTLSQGGNVKLLTSLLEMELK
jgi:hypothetical protein